MQIVDINGKKWLIGLDWEILPGDKSIKQESSDIAERKSCNYGLIVDYGNQFAIGLATKNAKEPSAALYLALANQEVRSNMAGDDMYPDWIVIEEMSDDKYWYVVIKEGIPSPQVDAILDLTTIKGLIGELLIHDTYRLFTPCGEIANIFDGIKEVEPKSLNDLTEGVKTKIKLEKMRGIPPALMYAGAGVIALMALGWGGMQFMEGRDMAEKMELIKKEQEQEELRKKQEYEVKLKKFKEDSEKAKNEALQTVINGLTGTPKPMLYAWYNAVADVPMGTHGWELKRIECYFQPETPQKTFACDYLYNRTGLTTNRMLLEDYPTARIVGNEAVITKNIEVDPVALQSPGIDVISQLPSTTNWGFDMLSQLQLLKIANIDYSIKQSTEVTYTLPPAVPPPGQLVAGVAETVSLNVGKGEIIVKGDHFELLKELADNVDYSAVALKKVSFDVSEISSIRWEATFNYFLNTKTGLMAAGNSNTLENSAVAAPAQNVQVPLPPGAPQ